QLSQHCGAVLLRAPLGHFHLPHARERLKPEKQVGAPVAQVFVVLARWLAGLHRLRLPLMVAQRLVRLLVADLRALRGVGPVVDLQHVLHLGHELAVRLARQTPLLLQPGLEFPLLSTWRTVSCEILSTWPNSTIWFANSRGAQRWCPSGGSLQTRALIFAF